MSRVFRCLVSSGVWCACSALIKARSAGNEPSSLLFHQADGFAGNEAGSRCDCILSRQIRRQRQPVPKSRLTRLFASPGVSHVVSSAGRTTARSAAISRASHFWRQLRHSHRWSRSPDDESSSGTSGQLTSSAARTSRQSSSVLSLCCCTGTIDVGFVQSDRLMNPVIPVAVVQWLSAFAA